MIIMFMVKISDWGSLNLQYLDMGSRVKKVGKPCPRGCYVTACVDVLL